MLKLITLSFHIFLYFCTTKLKVVPSYGISFFKGLKYCSYRYFARTQFLYGIFWMALGVAWIYLPPIHFDMEMSRQICDREISLKAWNWRGDSYLANFKELNKINQCLLIFVNKLVKSKIPNLIGIICFRYQIRSF